MPVKDSDSVSKLYFMTPDGTQHEFSGIQSVDIVDEEFNDDHDGPASKFLFSSNEASFTATFTVNVLLLYFITHGRYPSNNWRRMHGLPLKRKMERRRKNANTGRA